MVVSTHGGTTTAPVEVEVVATSNLKAPFFSGKHGDVWTNWEMKMTAHLMDKGLDTCLKLGFNNKLPQKRVVQVLTMKKEQLNYTRRQCANLFKRSQTSAF